MEASRQKQEAIFLASLWYISFHFRFFSLSTESPSSSRSSPPYSHHHHPRSSAAITINQQGHLPHSWSSASSKFCHRHHHKCYHFLLLSVRASSFLYPQLHSIPSFPFWTTPYSLWREIIDSPPSSSSTDHHCFLLLPSPASARHSCVRVPLRGTSNQRTRNLAAPSTCHNWLLFAVDVDRLLLSMSGP